MNCDRVIDSIGHKEYLPSNFELPGIKIFTQFSCSIVGNPLICAAIMEQDCYGSLPMPMSYGLNNTQGMQSQSVHDASNCIKDTCAQLSHRSKYNFVDSKLI